MKDSGFIRKFCQLIGRQAIFWAFTATISAIGLVAVEMAIASGIQALLVALGANFDLSTMPQILRKLPNDAAFVGIFLIVVAGIRGGLQLAQAHGNFMIRESVLYRLRVALLGQMLGEQGSFIRSAEVQTNLSEVYPKAALCSYFIVNAVIASIQSLGLVGVLFWLSPKGTLVACVGVIIVGLATRASSQRLREVAAQMPRAQLHLNEGLQRIARNWLFVRIMRVEEVETKRLRLEIDSYHRASVRGVFWSNANGVVAPFLGVILIVTIVHLGQNLWHTPGAVLITFLYMLLRFIGSLTVFVNALSAVSLNFPPLKTVLDRELLDPDLSQAAKFLSLEPQTSEILDQDRSGIILPPSIELRNVSMRFSGKASCVLNELSLNLSGGRQVGILGPSGSGKTTVLNIILGILSPTSGQVLIGGHPAKEVMDRGLLRVGYVGPDPLLIEGTIAQNLRYGLRNEVTDSDLQVALKSAHLWERIQEFPLKLDEPLNEHADILSAGQKQRLSLARALAARPDILVLDEASANLDDATESEIVKSLANLRGSCTILIVSHRKGILQDVDQVLDLSQG